jgi:uncharacterized protein (DUF3820 family)
MSSIETLPLIPFGKYKGKPVTEIISDTEYLKWLSLQPWFKEKHPTIYNITINQTISNNDSKTPEHNKIQNMFLEENFCNKVLEHLYKKDIINDFTTLYKLVSDNEDNEDIMKYSNDYIKSIDVDVEFEASYNWDIILTPKTFNPIILSFAIDKQISSKLKIISLYNCEEKSTECGYKKKLTYRICIEIKPFLGDDYPSVLRKMKTQIMLMGTPRIVRTGYRNITHYPEPCVFILLIKEFKSETTSEQQLIKIFNQTNIKVIFL